MMTLSRQANIDLDHADRVVDARDVVCPLPVLRTKLAIAEMQCGETVLTTATDPHSELDFEVFCERCGHELLRTRQEHGGWSFLIRIGTQPRR